MTAKDVAGRELKVGQTVAHTARAEYRGLVLSKVVKVNAKTVELDNGVKRGYYSSVVRREHAFVCIVEDV